ncbi:hypothetical protein OH491_23585 [Termitidicoccus mucosus]|uniref:Uncharacterized protein n=1 Tax=Termitidicoccus mucosus TaxID=1184151 RepID=A0A178INN4_9BACT|nr:hypothetical protein AW736_02890 [Opitutaceae bacterium TSB47]
MHQPDQLPPFLFLGIPQHRLPRLAQDITQDSLVLSDFFATGQNEPIRFRTSEIIARTDAVVQNPGGILEADARSGAVIRIDAAGLQNHGFEIDGNSIALGTPCNLTLPAGTWAFSNNTLDFLIEIIGKAGTPKEKQCARLLCEFDHSPVRRLDAVFEFLKIYNADIDAAVSSARAIPAFTVGKDTFSVTPFNVYNKKYPAGVLFFKNGIPDCPRNYDQAAREADIPVLEYRAVNFHNQNFRGHYILDLTKKNRAAGSARARAEASFDLHRSRHAVVRLYLQDSGATPANTLHPRKEFAGSVTIPVNKAGHPQAVIGRIRESIEKITNDFLDCQLAGKPFTGFPFQFKSRETPESVHIRRGNRVPRLVPEQIPEPIEAFPSGAIAIDAGQSSMLNSFPGIPMAPQF